MSQVEHRAERSFAIKGTLVFTAQRDQFTIMEDAYLVCEGKKVAGAYDTVSYTHLDVYKRQDHGGLCGLPAKIQSIERKRFLNLRIAGTFFLDLPCQNRGCMVSSNCKRGEIEAQKRRQYHVLSKVRKRTPGI